MKEALTRTTIAFLLTLFAWAGVPTPLAAQAPGGLDADQIDLRLWLIADSITATNSNGQVSYWPDESGNDNPATQLDSQYQPQLVKGQWGGQDVVDFDGTDFMTGVLSALGDSGSVIVVGRFDEDIQSTTAFFITVGDGSEGGTISLGRSGDPQQQDRFVNKISSDSILYGAPVEGGAAARRILTYGWSNGSDNLLASNNYDDDVEESSGVLAPGGTYTLGAWADTSGLLSGEIAEVIVLDSWLDDAERSVVATYLGARYNLSDPVRDFGYDPDLVGDTSNFIDHEVMGVTQRVNNTIVDTVGSGGMLLANVDFLQNANDYVFVGHNDSTGITEDNSLSGQVDARLSRIWGVNVRDETPNGGNIEMRFYLNELIADLDTADTSNYVLLSSSTLPPNFSEDATVVDRQVDTAGNYIAFILPASQLQDGGAYTLGTLDTTQSPIPVELASFDATYQNEDDRVALNWATASEENNAKFIIERSKDGRHFEMIGQTPGQGTTIDRTQYTEFDREPLSGTNYYRLKQVDYDGSYEFSAVVAVQIEEGLTGLTAAPNPFREQVQLSVNAEQQETAQLTVLDQVGRVVTQRQVELNRGNNQVELNLSGYDSGWYIVKVQDGQNSTVMKLMKY